MWAEEELCFFHIFSSSQLSVLSASCWHLTCLFFSSSHVFWPHEHWRVLLGLSAICIPWDCHYHGFGDYDDYGGYDDDILTFHISNVSWGNYGCRSDIKTCVTNIILRTAINPKQGYIIVDGSCKLDFAQNKQLLRCLIRKARNQSLKRKPGISRGNESTGESKLKSKAGHLKLLEF